MRKWLYRSNNNNNIQIHTPNHYRTIHDGIIINDDFCMEDDFINLIIIDNDDYHFSGKYINNDDDDNNNNDDDKKYIVEMILYENNNHPDKNNIYSIYQGILITKKYNREINFQTKINKYEIYINLCNFLLENNDNKFSNKLNNDKPINKYEIPITFINTQEKGTLILEEYYFGEQIRFVLVKTINNNTNEIIYLIQKNKCNCKNYNDNYKVNKDKINFNNRTFMCKCFIKKNKKIIEPFYFNSDDFKNIIKIKSSSINVCIFEYVINN